MIGEVLRVSRIANDMSIKQTSKQANVSVSYITEMEKNKRKNPSIEVLKKLCDVYSLNISEILEIDAFHDSIINKKEKLEIYRLLLLKILSIYDEKQNNIKK